MKRFLQKVGLYLFHVGFARPVLYWIVGVRFRRRSLLPKGACLVVSNHNSHLDAAVLMSMFPLRRLPKIHPVAAADYFGSTWFKQALAMSFMNGIPISRRPKKGQDPLQPLKDQINNGHSLVFFPEGSRGEAGVVARFRPGIGKLVQQLPGLLVVPVFLAGPERIWPRGQTVPVPFNIDAIIGKPRSYSPDDDPRSIAEQVQHDVLSLAPPPPPPPGETVQTATRISICGIDGTLRAELMRRITERLGRSAPAVGLGRSIVEAHDGEVREVSAPRAQIPYRAWTKLLARLLGAGSRLRGRRFTAMIESARVAEAVVARHPARYVVGDGDALVDLAAWAMTDIYRGVFDERQMSRVVRYLSGEQKIPFGKWWSFLRKAPEVWLVNELSLVRPGLPDLLLLASPPIGERMQTLRGRGNEQEPHETEPAQTQLLEGYRRLAELLRRRHGVDVVEWDPETGIDAAVEAIVLRAEGRGDLGLAEPLSRNPSGNSPRRQKLN